MYYCTYLLTWELWYLPCGLLRSLWPNCMLLWHLRGSSADAAMEEPLGLWCISGLLKISEISDMSRSCEFFWTFGHTKNEGISWKPHGQSALGLQGFRSDQYATLLDHLGITSAADWRVAAQVGSVVWLQNRGEHLVFLASFSYQLLCFFGSFSLGIFVKKEVWSKITQWSEWNTAISMCFFVARDHWLLAPHFKMIPK